jgi:hypothetical protein
MLYETHTTAPLRTCDDESPGLNSMLYFCSTHTVAGNDIITTVPVMSTNTHIPH